MKSSLSLQALALSFLSILFSIFIFFLSEYSSISVKEYEKVLGSFVEQVLEGELSTKDEGNKEQERFRVTRIIDGDTVEIQTGEKVRYIGIDTPELTHPKLGKECFGEEAKEINASLVLNKRVRLEKDVSDTDRYGRLLRYVFVLDDDEQEIFVNHYLVTQGFALASTYPPDVKYQDIFKNAEREARTRTVGLWKSCR